jgi:hypothetical protein
MVDVCLSYIFLQERENKCGYYFSEKIPNFDKFAFLEKEKNISDQISPFLMM